MQSYLQEGWEELRKEIKELDNKKDTFFKELNINLEQAKKTCRTCKYGTKNTRELNGETIACWYGTIWGKGEGKGYERHPSIHEPLDGCNKHENR